VAEEADGRGDQSFQGDFGAGGKSQKIVSIR
jgi:hypothetical protein